MNKDYVTRNEFNIKTSKQKFYLSRQYYAGDTAQSIYGVSAEKLWSFGDIVIDFPRSGVYEITTYIYCYAGNGGDAMYYITLDGVRLEGNAIILGQNRHIVHPLVTFAEISAGTHTINVYGYEGVVNRSFDMSNYNKNQIIIKEL